MILIIPKVRAIEYETLSLNFKRDTKVPTKNKQSTNEIIEVMKQIFPFSIKNSPRLNYKNALKICKLIFY